MMSEEQFIFVGDAYCIPKTTTAPCEDAYFVSE
jgi:hypothetical protein